MAFPTDPLDVTVELRLGSTWTDITDKVLVRDSITIKRGLPDEGTQASPSEATMSINNADGVFSPRNPTSPYYGLIGRNTPIRVSVEGSVRFVGEVSAWPSRWDVSGRDVWVPITAQGVLRRLRQGADTLRSVMYRGMTNPALTVPPVAYWPCEDGDEATSLASAVGGAPMKVTGTPQLAQFSGFAASDPIPLLSGSEWSGIVPAYPLSGAVQTRFLLNVPTGGTGNQQTICRLRTSGSAYLWHLNYGTGGTLQLQAFGENGGLLDTGFVTFNVNGRLLRVSIELTQNGSNIDWAFATLEPGASSGQVYVGTITGQTIGLATRVIISPDGGIDDVAIGHVSVQPQITDLFDLSDQLSGYVGEPAGRRIERLCAEEGIPFVSTGDLDVTTMLGPQRSAMMSDLLAEAAEADMGLLYEPRDVLGLAYRTRVSLYNQAPAVELDYAAGHLVPPLEPVDDDQATRNDITVTRQEGSSARAVRQSGPLSVQPPPHGVGRYTDSVTVGVRRDTQLPDQAGWRLHLGTVDETRYPQVTVNLARIAADAALVADVVGLDVGHRLTIDHLPVWLPPDPVTQLAMGYTETLESYGRLLEITCVPESPYQVGVYGTARYGTAGSQLASGVSSSATTLSVTSTSGPRWTTDPAEFPFDITVGGERMTVTAITGAGTTQTFTVVRSVNGVFKTHSSGAAVVLAEPAIRAL